MYTIFKYLSSGKTFVINHFNVWPKKNGKMFIMFTVAPLNVDFLDAPIKGPQ